MGILWLNEIIRLILDLNLHVDGLLKPVIGTKHVHNGLLFHFVEGRCGSLPCPPYEETKELTCASDHSD